MPLPLQLLTTYQKEFFEKQVPIERRDMIRPKGKSILVCNGFRLFWPSVLQNEKKWWSGLVHGIYLSSETFTISDIHNSKCLASFRERPDHTSFDTFGLEHTATMNVVNLSVGMSQACTNQARLSLFFTYLKETCSDTRPPHACPTFNHRSITYPSIHHESSIDPSWIHHRSITCFC